MAALAWRRAQLIAGGWTAGLESDDLDYDTPLQMQGMDSRGLLLLAKSINKAFHLQVRPAVVFDYPTLRTLAEHITELAYGDLGNTDVAITGVSCRLPGGIEGPSDWRELHDGQCAVEPSSL